jgi:hypothetical protein
MMWEFNIRIMLAGFVLGLTLLVFSWSPELHGYHHWDHRWSLRMSGALLLLSSLAFLLLKPA